MRLLPLLLLLVSLLYIRGDNNNSNEVRTENDGEKDQVYEKVNSKVPTKTELVEAMNSIFPDQHENLESRLTGNNHKIKRCLTDGIDGLDLSSVTEEVAKALAMLETDKECCNCSQPEQIAKEEGEDVEPQFINQESAKPSAVKPASCAEIDGGKASGIHQIHPNKTSNVSARCVNVYGGGWTVIQERSSGKVDFYRGWDDYAKGFGNPAGEYWLGLHHINAITTAQSTELYVGLNDFDQGLLYAKYSKFLVSPETDKFRIHVKGYSGSAVDALHYHDLQPFSTKDRDNDRYYRSCSIEFHGAWWYKNCHCANLNGLFSKTKAYGWKYMIWEDKFTRKAMRASVMMIRPSYFKP